jgi:hypothetical protein
MAAREAAIAARTRAAAAVAASATFGDTARSADTRAAALEVAFWDFEGDVVNFKGEFGDRGGEGGVARRTAGIVSVSLVDVSVRAMRSFDDPLVGLERDAGSESPRERRVSFPGFGDVRGDVALDPTALPVPSGVLDPGA